MHPWFVVVGAMRAARRPPECAKASMLVVWNDRRALVTTSATLASTRVYGPGPCRVSPVPALRRPRAACDDTYRVHYLFGIPNSYHEPDLTLLSDLLPCLHTSGHAPPHPHTTPPHPMSRLPSPLLPEKLCSVMGILPRLWLGGGGGCGLGRGVGVLGEPRAGVDGLWRLCCGVAVGGPFAGGRPSVF